MPHSINAKPSPREDFKRPDFRLGNISVEVKSRLREAVVRRPRRRDDLDQCPATTTTVLKRLLLLLCSQLENKSILILGDDDLLSVALSACNIPCTILVVDTDLDLLKLIRQKTDPSRIQTFQWDLRESLPTDFLARFDIIFTDPPYTVAGQLAFLRNAVLALRPKEGSTLFFCASRLYLTEFHINSISHFLRNASLTNEGTFEDFNEYEAPPDVLEDMRRLRGHSSDTTFHSTLFQFVASSLPIRPFCIEEGSTDIYSYDFHNVTS